MHWEADVNGQEPNIVGQVCEALIAIEYRHSGEVVEPANQVLLRFSGTWFRLYFDHAIVFWRESLEGPRGVAAEELNAEFRPIDLGQVLGVQGLVLTRIAYVGLADGVAVELAFEWSRVVRFACENDVTRYSAYDRAADAT
jgi:hypothetical protein